MPGATSTQRAAVAAFRSLHASGCFVMPNPWDIGTAMYLEQTGFRALATTSAGFAFSRGASDDAGDVPQDAMLAHIREIVAATRLPVNADFQSCFADEPADVAVNVGLCIATGVAGLSIEDATGDSAVPLYDLELAIERVRAARQAVDASEIPVVLTARCEAWLVGQQDPVLVAIDRLVAYAEAGADCLYAPGVREPGEISAIVKAVHPKPVNVLVSAPAPAFSVSRLAELGVRRISVGSALARVAWGAFQRAAREIATAGSFEALAGAAPFAELNGFFRDRRQP